MEVKSIELEHTTDSPNGCAAESHGIDDKRAEFTAELIVHRSAAVSRHAETHWSRFVGALDGDGLDTVRRVDQLAVGFDIVEDTVD